MTTKNSGVYEITPTELAYFEELCALDLAICAELEKGYALVAHLVRRHLEIGALMGKVEVTGSHRNWANLQGLGQHTLWRAAAQEILAAALEPLRNFDASLPAQPEGPHRIHQIQADAVRGVLDKLRRVVSG